VYPYLNLKYTRSIPLLEDPGFFVFKAKTTCHPELDSGSVKRKIIMEESI